MKSHAEMSFAEMDSHSDFHVAINHVDMRRFERDATNRSIGFRCYKSSPDGATVQLRAEKQFANASYLTVAQLDDMIHALQRVRASLSKGTVK